MDTRQAMRESQQSAAAFTSAEWPLDAGAALRLRTAARGAGQVLLVTAGRLWLTRPSDEPGLLPADCWLEAGQSVRLPPGCEAVLEGWPSARFSLLQPAPSAKAAKAHGWRAALRRPAWTAASARMTA